MPRKDETPRNGGAWRNSCAGASVDTVTPPAVQAEFLVAPHQVSPELQQDVGKRQGSDGGCP
jgi:hypothetical protein